MPMCLDSPQIKPKQAGDDLVFDGQVLLHDLKLMSDNSNLTTIDTIEIIFTIRF